METGFKVENGGSGRVGTAHTFPMASLRGIEVSELRGTLKDEGKLVCRKTYMARSKNIRTPPIRKKPPPEQKATPISVAKGHTVSHRTPRRRILFNRSAQSRAPRGRDGLD